MSPAPAVTMDCYTANWNPLGEEAFYRKFELYTMEWGLKEDLRDCLVAAAPYGGPIALLKNNARKEKSPSTRPLLEIYSASGLLLASIPWKSGQLVQLGWTASEDLLCIQEDGTVLIYNLFCEFKRHFSMGNEVLQNHVLEAKVFHTEYGTGVAILTGAHRFSLTTNIDDLKLRRMPEVPGLQKPPSCWAVLTQDRVTIVLLAVGQDLYLLDNTSCSVVTPPGMSPSAGAYLQMAVSFNYRCLALFTDTGYIWMGLATLKDKLCEFNSTIRSPPKQMVWCTRPRSRQRAVVVAWDRQLMVAGDSTECIRYPLGRRSCHFCCAPPGATVVKATPLPGPPDPLSLNFDFPSGEQPTSLPALRAELGHKSPCGWECCARAICGFPRGEGCHSGPISVPPEWLERRVTRHSPLGTGQSAVCSMASLWLTCSWQSWAAATGRFLPTSP